MFKMCQVEFHDLENQHQITTAEVTIAPSGISIDMGGFPDISVYIEFHRGGIDVFLFGDASYNNAGEPIKVRMVDNVETLITKLALEDES